jgi:hypothetical protein
MLDDLIIVPAGIVLLLKMIPPLLSHPITPEEKRQAWDSQT